jgi:hypothetical protein
VSAIPKLAELRRPGRWLQSHNVLDFDFSGVLGDPEEINPAANPSSKSARERRFYGDLVYRVDPNTRGLDPNSVTASRGLDMLFGLQAGRLSTPSGWPSLLNVENYCKLLRTITIAPDINTGVSRLQNSVTLKHTAEGGIEDFIVSITLGFN